MLPIWPPSAQVCEFQTQSGGDFLPFLLLQLGQQLPLLRNQRFLRVRRQRAVRIPASTQSPSRQDISLQLCTRSSRLLSRRKVVKTCPWHSLIKRNGTSAGGCCRLTAARVPASLSAWPPPAPSSLHESGTNPSAADSGQGNRRASQRQRPQGSPSPTEKHGKSPELVVQ